jgi:hypothetical protein
VQEEFIHTPVVCGDVHVHNPHAGNPCVREGASFCKPNHMQAGPWEGVLAVVDVALQAHGEKEDRKIAGRPGKGEKATQKFFSIMLRS